MNVIDIHAKWLGNFGRFEFLGGQFVPRERKLVRVIGSFEKSVGSGNRVEIIKLE